MSEQRIKLEDLPIKPGTTIFVKGKVVYSRLKNPISSHEELQKRAKEIRDKRTAQGKKAFPNIKPHRLITLTECELVDPKQLIDPTEVAEFSEDQKTFYNFLTYNFTREDGQTVRSMSKDRNLPTEEAINRAKANGKEIIDLRYYNFVEGKGYTEMTELNGELSKDQTIYIQVRAYFHETQSKLCASFDAVYSELGQGFEYYTQSSNPMLQAGFAVVNAKDAQAEKEAVKSFEEPSVEQNVEPSFSEDDFDFNLTND